MSIDMVIENSELILLVHPIKWVRPTYIFFGWAQHFWEYPGAPHTIVGRAQWDWGYLLDITICTKDISNSMYKKAWLRCQSKLQGYARINNIYEEVRTFLRVPLLPLIPITPAWDATGYFQPQPTSSASQLFLRWVAISRRYRLLRKQGAPGEHPCMMKR